MAENLQHTPDLETEVSAEPINTDAKISSPKTAMDPPPPETKALMKFSLKASSSSIARLPLFPKPVTPKDDEYVTEFNGK